MQHLDSFLGACHQSSNQLDCREARSVQPYQDAFEVACPAPSAVPLEVLRYGHALGPCAAGPTRAEALDATEKPYASVARCYDMVSMAVNV